MWINFDSRFNFITHLSNRLTYSSLNRLIGLFPLICLLIFSVSSFLDLSQMCTFVYTKKFLDSHDSTKINQILNSQKQMVQLSTCLYEETHLLESRSRIKRRLKQVRRNLYFLTCTSAAVYFLVILAAQFFIGIYLHFKLNTVLDYEMPQTIMKLLREYEQQRFQHLSKVGSVVKTFKSVQLNSSEENLINTMNGLFNCCGFRVQFDVWYRLGDLILPTKCEYQTSCLKEFAWYYLYFGVFTILFAASLRVCIQLVLLANFKFLLIDKLIRNVYEFDGKLYRNRHAATDDDNDESLNEKDRLKLQRKLDEIRRQKELLLEAEEEEERILKEKRDEENERFMEQERLQDQYEQMLARQNRFEELEFQRTQRKIQNLHRCELLNSQEY